MEVGIHSLHVRERNPLPQDHFVESANKECIQEPSVENGQANNSADELEIVEMLWVNTRVGIDL
jgi:hypothetical protein